MIEICKRVEKINAKPGDAHPNGDRGTVTDRRLDRRLHAAVGNYVAVEWDKNPGTQNLVAIAQLRELTGREGRARRR